MSCRSPAVKNSSWLLRSKRTIPASMRAAVATPMACTQSALRSKPGVSFGLNDAMTEVEMTSCFTTLKPSRTIACVMEETFSRTP
jgi:hypothetical protein